MRNYLIALLLVVSLGPMAGCGSSNASAEKSGADHHGHGHDHDHGHRPESLAAAFAQLVEIRDELREAMEAGQPDDAHHPLHEVGELLEVFPEIAADSDLSKEKWEVVNSEVDQLFTAFGTIDKAFHIKDGDKIGAYESVSETIDRSIIVIKEQLPEIDHEEHDHEEHDHED